jgi:CRP-like cAMP-binding protein
VLGVRGPDDVIGDLSALDGAPRSATALTVGQVEATVAPASILTRALTDPSTAMELLRIVAARLRDATANGWSSLRWTRLGGWHAGCRNLPTASARTPT